MPAQSYEAATTELSTHRAALGDVGYYSLLYSLQWAYSGLNVWTDVTYAYPQSKVVVEGPFVFPKASPTLNDPSFPIDVGTLLDTWRALVVLLKLQRKGSLTPGTGVGEQTAAIPGQGFVLSIGNQNILSIGGNDPGNPGQDVLSIGGILPVPASNTRTGGIVSVVLPPAPPPWLFRYFGYRL
jgi:hypothetical protein